MPCLLSFTGTESPAVLPLHRRPSLWQARSSGWHRGGRMPLHRNTLRLINGYFLGSLLRAIRRADDCYSSGWSFAYRSETGSPAGISRIPSKNLLRLRFEDPRILVMIDRRGSPMNSRPMRAGRWRGGFAPIASARPGNQTDTSADSSSTTL